LARIANPRQRRPEGQIRASGETAPAGAQDFFVFANAIAAIIGIRITTTTKDNIINTLNMPVCWNAKVKTCAKHMYNNIKQITILSKRIVLFPIL